MSGFTDQQKKYIEHIDKIDTKLIACAGSGKTRCIIFKIKYLLDLKIFKPDEILMLTFSRFTRDDFLNRLKKYNVNDIDKNCVKTIDSFAKNAIDPNNEIDVSLLSYKFMKYLEQNCSENIKKNNKISNIKIIFIDESQDLNETQFKILQYLKEKCDILLNLIGDPNQNIYQFRHSSDKYLTNFNAKTFFLTKNFRSHEGIINFSKYLRPIQDLDVSGTLGNLDCLPTIVFHESDEELEKYLITTIKDAMSCNINLSEIAILAPTRGRMRGYGRSHGLCLISNILFKNKIKFKQFYEEAVDEFNSNIKYNPKKDHINILTYMGSKGLEWKYVILIDADICLINKRLFNDEKHKNDQYLLYVACSRAINNVIIFSKYRFCDGNLNFQLNPWFSNIPTKHYNLDTRFIKYLKYPIIKPRDMGENEKRITKIIDKFEDKILDKLANLCKYGCDITVNKAKKTITKIYNKDFSTSINSSIFLGKYVENLFLVYYAIKHKKIRKTYSDIENIISSKHIITDVPISFNEWFYANRDHYTWEIYDNNKLNLEKQIIDTIESKFNRNNDFCKHTIVNDGYFKSFILSMKDTIKHNYNEYLETTDKLKIRKYLFFLIVIIYSLETQHYFHVMSKGKKFKNILIVCSDLFNKIQDFADNTQMQFTQNNICISKWGLIGEIDLIETKENKNIIWELKCVSDISLKNIIQVLIYNIIYNNIENNEQQCTISTNFINLLKGELVSICIDFQKEELEQIKQIFLNTNKN